MNVDSQLLLTTLTRFGTILFVVFTISVVLHVYRYVMRLAAYTHARADALELMIAFTKTDAERYQKFVTALNAERIDFGKSPSTPQEQVLELAKLLSKIEKDKS